MSNYLGYLLAHSKTEISSIQNYMKWPSCVSTFWNIESCLLCLQSQPLNPGKHWHCPPMQSPRPWQPWGHSLPDWSATHRIDEQHLNNAIELVEAVTSTAFNLCRCQYLMSPSCLQLCHLENLGEIGYTLFFAIDRGFSRAKVGTLHPQQVTKRCYSITNLGKMEAWVKLSTRKWSCTSKHEWMYTLLRRCVNYNWWASHAYIILFEFDSTFGVTSFGFAATPLIQLLQTPHLSSIVFH